MAKMKKRRLRWKASESQQAVGYRLYWAEGGEVGYDSPCVALGNVTEVILPDDVTNWGTNRILQRSRRPISLASPWRLRAYGLSPWMNSIQREKNPMKRRP